MPGSGLRDPGSEKPAVMVSTRVPVTRPTPQRLHSSRRALSTSRDRLESGKSLPCASSWSGTPSERNQSTTSPGGNALRILRMTAGLPPLKSRSVTATFVTLQREPPLIRIFAPGRTAESISRTEREGFRCRVKIAVESPAAPAPIIAISYVSSFRRRSEWSPHPRPSCAAGPHHPSRSNR